MDGPGSTGDRVCRRRRRTTMSRQISNLPGSGTNVRRVGVWYSVGGEKSGTPSTTATGLFRSEGRIVDASKSGEWADWVDVEERLPWLTTEPYLLKTEDLEKTLVSLEALGFRVIMVQAPDGDNLEKKLLIELSRSLDFTPVGAGSWAAFSDRLWDLLSEAWDPPVAVFVEGADRLLATDLHVFVRCVHNLVSLTERVGLADDQAQRQVVYFFVGHWT